MKNKKILLALTMMCLAAPLSSASAMNRNGVYFQNQINGLLKKMNFSNMNNNIANTNNMYDIEETSFNMKRLKEMCGNSFVKRLDSLNPYEMKEIPLTLYFGSKQHETELFNLRLKSNFFLSKKDYTTKRNEKLKQNFGNDDTINESATLEPIFLLISPRICDTKIDDPINKTIKIITGAINTIKISSDFGPTEDYRNYVPDPKINDQLFSEIARTYNWDLYTTIVKLYQYVQVLSFYHKINELDYTENYFNMPQYSLAKRLKLDALTDADTLNIDYMLDHMKNVTKNEKISQEEKEIFEKIQNRIFNNEKNIPQKDAVMQKIENKFNNINNKINNQNMNNNNMNNNNNNNNMNNQNKNYNINNNNMMNNTNKNMNYNNNNNINNNNMKNNNNMNYNNNNNINNNNMNNNNNNMNYNYNNNNMKNNNMNNNNMNYNYNNNINNNNMKNNNMNYNYNNNINNYNMYNQNKNYNINNNMNNNNMNYNNMNNQRLNYSMKSMNNIYNMNYNNNNMMNYCVNNNINNQRLNYSMNNIYNMNYNNNNNNMMNYCMNNNMNYIKTP